MIAGFLAAGPRARRLALPRLPGSGWIPLLAATLLAWVMLLAAPAAAARDATAYAPKVSEVQVEDLPVQARRTLALILDGGPFPYRKDGTVFFNRERLLPRKPRGYYTEYTVPTPGSRDRGARRIVVGGERGRLDTFYYTDDHYASFRKIRDPMR